MTDKPKSKIEIVNTGMTTAKVLLNGQDISNVVTRYKIEHNAQCIARLGLIVGKPFTDVQIDEICEVTIRQEDDKKDGLILDDLVDEINKEMQDGD